MKRRTVVIAALAVGLVLSAYFGLTLGYASIPKGDILNALGSLFGRPAHVSPATQAIVLDIRLPRVLLALLTGVALAVSGLVMQAVVGNPVADPYILGISSGASLGATLALSSACFPPSEVSAWVFPPFVSHWQRRFSCSFFRKSAAGPRVSD